MKHLIIIFLFVIAVAGCKKLDQYPEIPEMTFKSVSFERSDTGTYFVYQATVTDGDGDIGYKKDESNGTQFDSPTSEYYHNFVLKLEYYDNGTWKEYKLIKPRNDTLVKYDTIPFEISSRLDYLTPDGKNKAIKIEIEKIDEMPLYVPDNPADYPQPFNDTIRFQGYVYDRALHKSNVVTSPEYLYSAQ